MQSLEHYLKQIFAGPRAGGDRMVAASEAHAVHESGYDVCYSRYSVTYRDGRGEQVLAAEIDDEGVLVVHSSGCSDRLAVQRIDAALAFLDVKHEHL